MRKEKVIELDCISRAEHLLLVAGTMGFFFLLGLVVGYVAVFNLLS